MRALLFTAGVLATALGFIGHARTGDAQLLQGALTLGGGWVICGLFSLSSKWHGIAGGGVLGLLAAARCAPALGQLGGQPAAPFQVAALILSLIVLGAAVRALLSERARRQLEAMQQEDPEA